MPEQNLAAWIKENATTVDTLDPAAPLDDLEPLRELVGDARVVAIGESAHHVQEFYRLRHRVLRFLVERCGFTDYAFEAAYTGARTVDAWVRSAPGILREYVGAADMELLQCAVMDDTLDWMRAHNTTAARPLRFLGVVAGSGGGSPLEELAELTDYLRTADPDAVPLAERALDTARAFHGSPPMGAFMAYRALDTAARDALTADLSRLRARMESMPAHQKAQGRGTAHRAAMGLLAAARQLDHLHRDIAGTGLAIGTTSLDAFMAEAVLNRLDEGGPGTRVVLGLHNVHIRTTEVAHDGPAGLFPAGYALREALGADYVAIGVTGGAGTVLGGEFDPDSPTGYIPRRLDAETPVEGSVETAFAASHASGAALTVADLRAARPHVTDAATFQQMRSQERFTGAPVFDAFDAFAYVPRWQPTEYTPDSA
ncbi:erythromycin esterase [Murinocardiopsis flavida]|uniref:Erythromycin esterase n=1 Tax=Murinocardiopsis flavida TaxID=645275 RepID=A0A2P8CQV9_9ACTN|nr:erythromycin esterase family protein [Murinocardiopsis flavida]PSK87348.1 erythromycin esterase [Murinocardiopsis flavida]